MILEDYIKEISRKVEYLSISIINLYETPLDDIFVYEKRNYFKHCVSFSRNAIICPKGFNPKFIIRNLIRVPVLFDYPMFFGDRIEVKLLNANGCGEFVYLTIYSKKYDSFKNALIDIHNKNISKNFNLIKRFVTSNKKFKTY